MSLLFYNSHYSQAVSAISERENTPNIQEADSVNPPQAPHATPEIKATDYEHLIEMKELPSTGHTVYKCKKMPRIDRVLQPRRHSRESFQTLS